MSSESTSQAETPDSKWLIQQARAGSLDAIEELVRQCRDYLLLIANQELDNPLQAKIAPSDVVQETLVKAYERFDQFQGSSEREFIAWVRRILLNQLVNVRRDLHRAKRDVGREQSLAENSRQPSRQRELPAKDQTPSRQLSDKESTQRLLDAMQSLPEDYRQVIILRNWQRLPFVEIGERLGRSKEAVNKLWLRAIKQLQVKMNEPLPLEPD